MRKLPAAVICVIALTVRSCPCICARILLPLNRQYFALGGQIYVTAQNAIDIWKSLGMIRGNVAAADLLDPEFINK